MMKQWLLQRQRPQLPHSVVGWKQSQVGKLAV
jgi:hypothetical protein